MLRIVVIVLVLVLAITIIHALARQGLFRSIGDLFLMTAIGALGAKIADVDQIIPFLNHRSAVTHSIFLPMVLAMVPGVRAAAGPLFLGMSCHLVADFFPSRMSGFALIQVPGWGSIGVVLSYVWLGINALIACAMGHALLKDETSGFVRFLVTVALGIGAYYYLLVLEGSRWAFGAFITVYGLTYLTSLREEA